MNDNHEAHHNDNCAGKIYPMDDLSLTELLDLVWKRDDRCPDRRNQCIPL